MIKEKELKKNFDRFDQLQEGDTVEATFLKYEGKETGGGTPSVVEIPGYEPKEIWVDYEDGHQAIWRKYEDNLIAEETRDNELNRFIFIDEIIGG